MQKDAAYMKLIEEISLNAWPSHKIELYDGWLIRFSHNYTYRTNSVEQVGDSLIPIEEKIAYCEAQYRNYHTPSNFKINPLLDSSFDKLLEEKGYEIRHTTEVMTMPMTNFHPYPAESVEYEYYGRNSNLPSSVFYPGHIAVQLRRFAALYHRCSKRSRKRRSSPVLKSKAAWLPQVLVFSTADTSDCMRSMSMQAAAESILLVRSAVPF